MWISQKLIAVQKENPAAEVAKVTGSAIMQGINEYRGLPTAAPWGIAYLPPNTSKTVVVNTNEGNVCIGTLSQSQGLKPGEIKLFSAGGANIVLKNSGEIVINGKVFPAEKEE
jgi:phage gp45-like